MRASWIRPPRPLLLLLLLLLLFAGAPVVGVPVRAAWAHGGQFIPPPPFNPPGPPLIPTPGPPGKTPPTPPGAPSLPTPTLPGGPAAPPTAPGLAAPRGRSLATADPNASWETWWGLNRLALLPDRRAAFERRVVTPRDADDPDRWARQRVEMAEKEIVPFLLGLLRAEPAARDDVVASTLLALAKVSNGAPTVAVLRRFLDDARAAPLVREAAALAFGLLRRSDPQRQVRPEALDELRAHLLAFFDDDTAPTRARAFAVLAVGLLGDQGFSTAFTKDGRLTTRALWQRLEGAYAHRDLPVALLTALGQQPPAGVPDGVREALRGMVLGKQTLGRRWDPVERGHALTAVLRLGGPDAAAYLVRVLEHRRAPRDVFRAAFSGIGHVADDLGPEGRREVARALERAMRQARDPLSRGLAHIAAGQLLGSDLRAGSSTVLRTCGLARTLAAEARNGPTTTRGFSLLAVALAVRDVPLGDELEVRRTVDETRRFLVEALDEARGDPRVLGATAVAVGLAGAEDGRPALRRLVLDRDAASSLRGHAAVALGQLGSPSPEDAKALHVALADPRDQELRRQAALGLALLGGRSAVTQLLRQLREGETERLLAQVVIALGRIGDLVAVHPLTAYASEAERSELSQALAVVALGLIGDPEPRPSLLRLTYNAFYAARTDALHEAYTIL